MQLLETFIVEFLYVIECDECILGQGVGKHELEATDHWRLDIVVLHLQMQLVVVQFGSQAELLGFVH